MAIALIAGLAAAGTSVAVYGLTAAAFTAFAIGAGLSMVSRALMPKPDVGQQLSGTEFTVREPDASRKMIYGRTRVGGAVVFIESTGDDNKYIHMVIAVAGHEIDAFETKSISILSNEESKTLRMIRRNYNNLESITIRFKKAKPTHLEIKTTKKVVAESRIIEHIQKGDYSTIVIKTVDGSIVNFENTKKYKL